MLQGVLIDQTIEVLLQCTGDFRWSTGAWAICQTLCAFAGKAMAPLAQGGIGQGERVGDGLQALPFDDGAPSLGTAEDAGVFGLL
jgi:hypothetical protein